MTALYNQSWLHPARSLLLRRDASVLYSWIWAVLAFLIIVQAARLVWAIVTPVTPYGDWRPAGAEVIDPNARTLLFTRFDPFNRNAVQTQQTTDITALQLTLYGIRINQASGQGSAIIAGEDGVQKTFDVGQEIMPGVTLASVAFDHVTLSRNGAKESLYLDQSVPAETVGTAGTGNLPAGARVPVVETGRPASTAPAMPTNAATIRSAVSLAPRSNDGAVTGLTVSPGSNAQIFTATGLRSGDVITAINGQPVRSAADVEKLMGQLAPGARISVNVERGASEVPIAIVIPAQ
ncbi:type II secretion system protein N [Sphingorhabdus sp. Alg239-R122]|uniref:type II secretion system protein N n=1 Tax=Sphingorhabdus sp. Alg239-R122 TaxID=2305989 RepID=UPI0013DD179A|nr:type II secretion system protein N [Sphingorhabdus sp. Alg239-R122]